MKHPMNEMMTALESNKDIELPMDPAFYDRLHARIMAEVEKIEMKPSPWYEKPGTYLRAHWRSWLALGGSLSGLALAAQLGSIIVKSSLNGSHAVFAAQQEDRFLDQALQAPETVSRSILVSQADADFFMDVADRSFDNLSEEQFNRLIGGKRN